MITIKPKKSQYAKQFFRRHQAKKIVKIEKFGLKKANLTTHLKREIGVWPSD